ncbi:MAG: bifunctional pyr operon transcriptional regulator/uracil phosphoribosyltransferase PyrR [Candidatus Omnitrophota bacterium]|jgi:pyrimidine operon attenuation protein/uracil phosphoribosyltransferase|nr:MAG: bifunctional pyr operon transcriptional regulator/uracil phosphoribosyltransferase PyrR [Candidatus Omnitrophota bacterium]
MTETVNRRLIMSAEDIERTLRRMASQICEKCAGKNLALVGVRSRGATLAQRLKPLIQDMTREEIPVGVLDTGLYRDDIGTTAVAPEIRSTDILFDVEGKDIVLIDDVIYTGRTIRAALNALIDLGRPDRVTLLVLIDRGHRELPIQPDFIGQEVKTYTRQKVAVCLKEEDGIDAVYIVENE